MRSVAWRLLLAFVAVAVVGVGTVAYAANQTTREEFRSYVEMGGTMYALRVADSLAGFYSRDGSWRGVDQYLTTVQSMNMGNQRLLVAEGGVVVADSAGQVRGRRVADLGLGAGTPITAGERQVGTLYVLASATHQGMMGQGMMGWGNPRASSTQGSAQDVATLEESFLASVNRGLLLGALGAGVLAIGLSLLLTRQVVRPLNALVAGSRRLAAGDLSHRVDVASRDEFGTVAQAFNAMAESLERDEISRRHLLADVAHELRTPLTVIEGTADGILDGVLEPTREQIGIIKEEAGLLAKLVADLRDLSLAEAGQLRLDRQRQDLAEVVARAARGFEAVARERGLTLSVTAGGNLPPVSVDADRIAQAVGNLLSNAVRHTPRGGTVGVLVDLDPSDRRRAFIQVSDDGEGIAADDLAHVFERFYRADRSRSRRSGGAGLGLAIVKQIVEGHGGRVWATSEPGKGSTFYIALPVD